MIHTFKFLANQPLEINSKKINKAYYAVKAIDHEVRKNILHFLDKVSESTVTQIYINLRIEQSVVSQHLAMLRKANIVNDKREGKNIFYSINYQTLQKLNTFVCTF